MISSSNFFKKASSVLLCAMLFYDKKRKLQGLLFPEGLQFSLENKQNLTSKTSALFELTNCFSCDYDLKKERTYQQIANKSVYVPGAGVPYLLN